MTPQIFGILNVTRDSFSDGGKFFATNAAVAHAHALIAQGADVIDIGPASSHPDAEDVSAAEEISRLTPCLAAFKAADIPFSVDSFHPQTQRFALQAGATALNDIQGFSDPSLYAELASASASLVVMHSVQHSGKATREETRADTIVDTIVQFFDTRFKALIAAGVAEERLILDPGMGFFLGRDPACSVRVLQALPRLKAAFGRPLFVSVSRKSFLQAIVQRSVDDIAAATVAAEAFAVQQGADIIRTHAPAPLRDTLATLAALAPSAPTRNI